MDETERIDEETIKNLGRLNSNIGMKGYSNMSIAISVIELVGEIKKLNLILRNNKNIGGD